MSVETANETQHHNALIDMPEVCIRVDASKSHIYNMMERGQFPQPVVRMGSRFTRWSAQQVDQWCADPSAFIQANAKA